MNNKAESEMMDKPWQTGHPYWAEILRLARRRKAAVYVVGGCLRDRLIGRGQTDFDFAVDKNALALGRQFAKNIKGAFVLLDDEHGCGRVAKIIGGVLYTFDFADFRAASLKKDLAKRDFTINTLCAELSQFCTGRPADEILIDLYGAQKDLRAKKIRMVGPTAFRDDPLRLLRAFSLKAQLGFAIEAKTLVRIKKERGLIAKSSIERVREELFKILAAPETGQVLKDMDKTGLLDNVIPQIEVMVGVHQGGYHHLDVWKHSLETVCQLDRLLAEVAADGEMAAYLEEQIAGGHTRRAIVKLGALLHDIGKPDTLRREGERTTFHGHEHVGRSIVRSVAKMLKLSVRERHMLENLVLWHLRPGYLANFKQPTERALFRYFRDTGDEAVAIALLAWADQRATRGPLTLEKDVRHHEKICRGIIARYFQKQQEKPVVRLISGHDLIRVLKLEPSPLFARILRAVEEQQALGKVTTKKQALELAGTLAKGRNQ